MRLGRGRGSSAVVSGVSTYIHPTAIVEEDVEIGEQTSIWDHAHLRGPSRIGASCIIGGKTYVAPDVSIGDLVKVNSFVYVCSGVTIERGVMVAAGATFTNDRFPRAADPDLSRLRPSEADAHTRSTLVHRGATVGARAVVGSDLTIGEFAMIGMGSVVTHSVPDHHLVVGNPARSIGVVCRCGEPVLRFTGTEGFSGLVVCSVCGRSYRSTDGAVEMTDA